MDDQTQMVGKSQRSNSDNPVDEEGRLTELQNPLALDIDDKELVETVDYRVKDIRKFYAREYDLYNKRQYNEMMYFGRYIEEKEKQHLMKDYESRASHNVLWEIESNLKPIAMSRLPDLIVTAGNDSEQSRLVAQEISKAVDTDVKSRQNRKVLGLAFKQRPLYYTGIIKARWNNELDDYVFENIHPDMVDVDYTCTTSNADDMDLISQIVPTTPQKMLMTFPQKAEEMKKELEKDGIMLDNDGDIKYKDLATTIKMREVWFKWYKKHSETEYEPIWGVLWKYHDCILKKMKNPNFDYEGEKQWFTSTPQEGGTSDKHQSTQEEMIGAMVQAIVTGQIPQGIEQEQVYHNYFKSPRMPFYFMGYDQWGKQPYDETSRLEQNLANQKSLDKRSKQLEETLDNRGHHVWSKISGMKPSDVQAMDSNDPNEDYLVDGDVSQVHEYINPIRPDRSEFDDQDRIEDRMHKIGGDSAVQGQLQSDVATSNQIAREANFTRADDEVEDTINAAAEWMSQWSMQFMKLRYTEDHWRNILGIAGSVVKILLNRNMIEEGMLVMIKASGTDKLAAKNNAMDLAKLQKIDEVNFFRDMGFADYQERAEMLFTRENDPATYASKYIQNLQTSAEMANQLMKSPEAEVQAQIPLQPAQLGPGQPTPQGMMQQPVAQPQNPTPINTTQAPLAPPQGVPQGSPRLM